MKAKEHKQFKPYDRVLVRGRGVSKWDIELYSHYDKEKKRHETMCHYCDDDCNILPYEGNEHLLGTTEEPEEEVKLEEGEWVIGISYDEIEGFSRGKRNGVLGKVTGFTNTGDREYFNIRTYTKTFAIRFKDFNPSDMEETRKHILCVKNGKVVRYKE